MFIGINDVLQKIYFLSMTFLPILYIVIDNLCLMFLYELKKTWRSRWQYLTHIVPDRHERG